MNKTDIDWADMSWNPVTGCLHGCEYCYAHGIARRFEGFECRCGGEEIPCDKKRYGRNSIWNTTEGEALHVFHSQPQRRTKRGKFVKATFPYGFSPTLHSYRMGEPAKTKAPQSVFVCSMADLFGAWVPTAWIEDVFAACAAAPQHTYLFLTKNPARYVELDKEGLLPQKHYYGTTVTDHDTPYFWSDDYLTFISMEPLLRWDIDAPRVESKPTNGIIIGAETGSQRDKVVPQKAWIDDITQCADDEGIPVFYKKSLIPIVGMENMRRVLPWEVKSCT